MDLGLVKGGLYEKRYIAIIIIVFVAALCVVPFVIASKKEGYTQMIFKFYLNLEDNCYVYDSEDNFVQMSDVSVKGKYDTLFNNYSITGEVEGYELNNNKSAGDMDNSSKYFQTYPFETIVHGFLYQPESDISDRYSYIIDVVNKDGLYLIRIEDKDDSTSDEGTIWVFPCDMSKEENLEKYPEQIRDSMPEQFEKN